jgi:hypothetical protein
MWVDIYTIYNYYCLDIIDYTEIDYMEIVTILYK